MPAKSFCTFLTLRLLLFFFCVDGSVRLKGLVLSCVMVSHSNHTWSEKKIMKGLLSTPALLVSLLFLCSALLLCWQLVQFTMCSHLAVWFAAVFVWFCLTAVWCDTWHWYSLLHLYGMISPCPCGKWPLSLLSKGISNVTCIWLKNSCLINLHAV